MGKDVSDVVMGMLSDVGSATRAPAPIAPTEEPPPRRSKPAPRTSSVSPDVPGAVSAPVATPSDQPAAATVDAAKAPRTLRLRSEAASRLRAAWLEAKRDDVLLTAQDFASDLVMEALVSRRRRRTQTSA